MDFNQHSENDVLFHSLGGISTCLLSLMKLLCSLLANVNSQILSRFIEQSEQDTNTSQRFVIICICVRMWDFNVVAQVWCYIVWVELQVSAISLNNSHYKQALYCK